MANETTQNAATLGLGFHQFDGNVNVKDVIHQIGADFTVREDKLVRLPQDIFQKAINGEPVVIPANYVIQTHKATVHDGFDDTIGIVGNDYGTIQNNDAFDILDMMCNASTTDTPLKIVSAGLVNNYDPYIQAELPVTARVDGDKSDTKFYVFAHTSHDGTSALQIRFSPVRVICRNTYMANVSSKLGLNFKHSRYAAQRVDLTKEASIEKIRERVARLNLFTQEYIDQMNSYRLAKVTDEEVNEYVLNLLVDKSEMRDLARQYGYKYDTIEEFPTRTKNIIDTFKNILDSDDMGQDVARGTKLWLFHTTTNYLSNFASYGNQKDSERDRATKRFNSMLNGSANKKMEKAFALLAA